jgi:hypothetical protein
MATTLNAADLKTYSAEQVASLADVDFYAVRDEGFRRQAATEKKLARLAIQIAAARADLLDAHIIIEAAHREQNREAA